MELHSFDAFLHWLFFTPIGVSVLIVFIWLYRNQQKKKKQEEIEEEKREARKQARLKKKENTIVIKETKVTRIQKQE